MRKLICCFLLLFVFAGCTQQAPQTDESLIPYSNEEANNEKDNTEENNIEEEPNDIITVSNEPIDIERGIAGYEDKLFIQEPTLLWESEDAQAFNQMIHQEAEMCRESLTFSEDGNWKSVRMMNTHYYLGEDVLSIIVQIDGLLAEAGTGAPTMQVYNFSIADQKRLSNAQLLEMYAINVNDFQTLYNQIVSEDYVSCSKESEGELTEPCYVNEMIDESSLIYMKDNAFYIRVHVRQALYHGYFDYYICDVGHDFANETVSEEEKETVSSERKLPEGYYSITIPENQRESYFYATEIIGRNITDINDESMWKYDSSNEFLNWISNFDGTKEKTEHLHVNLPGAYAAELNRFFDEYFNSEIGNFGWQTISGWSESTQDVLSIVIRTRSSTPDGFYKGQWLETHAIDLKTYLPLTNEQLLERYDSDFEQAQNKIDDYLKHENIPLCEENTEGICHYESIFKSWISKNLSSIISDDSVLFLDDQGKLNMLIYVEYRNINENPLMNEKLTNFLIIPLS